jgi:hypothetical protein
MNGHDPYNIAPAAAAKTPQATDDLRKLLGVAWGRRTVKRILTDAGLDANTFSPNALQMAYAAGRRSVALDIANQINADSSTLYNDLMKESLNDD